MSETWLHNNRRALAMGMIPPALAGLCGLVLAAGGFNGTIQRWAAVVGAMLAALGAVLVASLAREMMRPRLAYETGYLIVHLGSASPLRVPIQIVEGFLLGQGPSMLPRRKNAKTETATLVIRLAERAEEWSHLNVKPALGKWCDGYVTIRGTWCEPLSVELVNRLNGRLAEVAREQSAQAGP